MRGTYLFRQPFSRIEEYTAEKNTNFFSSSLRPLPYLRGESFFSCCALAAVT